MITCAAAHSASTPTSAAVQITVRRLLLFTVNVCRSARARKYRTSCDMSRTSSSKLVASPSAELNPPTFISVSRFLAFSSPLGAKILSADGNVCTG